MLEGSNPKLAMQLNPLNIDAFVALSQSRLGVASSADTGDGLLADSKRLLAQSPGDARLYSIRGGLEAQQGNLQAAIAAFRHSLLLAPTELYALRWMIGRSVEEGDKAGLVDLMDPLFRRWPEQVATYAFLLPAILQTTDERRLLVRHLERHPPWRTALIARLSASQVGAAFAADLLWDLSEGASLPSPSEIGPVVDALLNAGRYDEAYQTFLVTLAPERRSLLGNVYNGDFSAMPTGTSFDWAVRRQPGVLVELTSADRQAGTSLLSLKFQQTPIKDPGIRQTLKLGPGRYRLSVKASASAAVLPKRLLWSLRCFQTGVPLASLPVSSGTYPMTETSVSFAVPGDQCGLQVLKLESRTLTGSWNDRYSGTVEFDRIKIVGDP